MSPVDSTPESGETQRGECKQQVLFGRFVLLECIAQEERYLLWRAHDRELARTLALAVFRDPLVPGSAAFEQVRCETSVALLLTHPHILRLHDFHAEGQLAALSMELPEGRSLEQVVRSRPPKTLTRDELLQLASQLCEAFEYAHVCAHVVHGNLKPSMVLVQPEGTVKISGFGSASTLASATTLRMIAPSISQTPDYRSPQVLAGAEPGPADDIFSLGLILWEMTTGSLPPITGINGLSSPALKTVGTFVSAEWENALLACMAREPSLRPRTAGDLARRLSLGASDGRSTSVSETVQVRPVYVHSPWVAPPGPSLFSLFSKRDQVLLILAALVLVGGLAWRYFEHSQTSHFSKSTTRAPSTDRVKAPDKP